MLTPQEVSERAFPKASFGGYNMAQVDEFLDLLTADYTSLYNENAVLKSKMKVLVEKVEEYRATEDAMRKALMTAQRMADELVKEAEAKKAQILSVCPPPNPPPLPMWPRCGPSTSRSCATWTAFPSCAPTPRSPRPTRWKRPWRRSMTMSSAWWPRPWQTPPPRI